MSATEVLRQAYDRGLDVRIAPSGNLLVEPARLLTPELRTLLVTHKGELLDFLADVEKVTHELIEAAMRACDHHGDGDDAREAMRRDCLATPPHLQADLLDHFRREYGNPTTKGTL